MMLEVLTSSFTYKATEYTCLKEFIWLTLQREKGYPGAVGENYVADPSSFYTADSLRHCSNQSYLDTWNSFNFLHSTA